MTALRNMFEQDSKCKWKYHRPNFTISVLYRVEPRYINRVIEIDDLPFGCPCKNCNPFIRELFPLPENRQPLNHDYSKKPNGSALCDLIPDLRRYANVCSQKISHKLDSPSRVVVYMGCMESVWVRFAR